MKAIRDARPVDVERLENAETSGAGRPGMRRPASDLPVQPRRFASRDGQTTAHGYLVEPERAEFGAATAGTTPLIPRGSGVCFVAASFGAGVRSVGAGRLDRVLDLDTRRRLVTVEAGITLAQLYQYTVPRQLYLPALPGHPQISVGGCIGANAHGKNPTRHGTFVDHVESLELFHPDHGLLHLSRDQDPELFELTVGGLGLTGIIVTATLRLRPLPSPWVEVRRRPVADLRATLQAMEVAQGEAEFSYSWNDLSVFDTRLGCGYVASGSFAPGAGDASRNPLDYPRHDPGATAQSRRIFQPALVPWITWLHRRAELLRRRQIVEWYDFVFPGMGFRNANYYGWYGREGMIAHMVLVPRPMADDYLAALDGVLRRHRVPLLVASMKLFSGRQRLLRFDGDGLSLHLHIPNDTRGRQLATALEGLSREARAPRAIYVDSRLTAADAELLFPELGEFRERLLRFDPHRRFASELSRRLGI